MKNFFYVSIFLSVNAFAQSRNEDLQKKIDTHVAAVQSEHGIIMNKLCNYFFDSLVALKKYSDTEATRLSIHCAADYSEKKLQALNETGKVLKGKNFNKYEHDSVLKSFEKKLGIDNPHLYFVDEFFAKRRADLIKEIAKN
jgi:hypothetical protein